MSLIVAIGGFSSNVGKTTLVCELLRELPGWEAIKLTRGHYRSCGKDPHACCVSHLLSDEPVIRSGRAATYAAGKDTGRYWDAGASDVHWVIVTDGQVEQGIRQALALVKAPGVIVEGTSFLRYIPVDFAVLVARAGGGPIKPSARRALPLVDAVYLSGDPGHDSGPVVEKPIYTPRDLPDLLVRIREMEVGPDTPEIKAPGYIS